MINQYVKESLDYYLDPWKKWNEWKDLLFEFCNKNSRVPTVNENYKSKNIGRWLHTQKELINSNTDKLYTKLITNKYIKGSLNDYLEYLDKNKDKVKLKWDEWKNLLFEFCNKNNRVPIRKDKYKSQNIGGWLQNQKGKINSNEDDLYKKLATNEYIKQSLDEYLEHKKQNKDKVKLKWNKWKDLLFEFCDINKKCPISRDKYKNQNIGSWLQDQKKKINSNKDELYKKLAVNEYIKQSLDEYLDPWKKWNKLKDLLFKFCDINKKCPSNKDKYKNHNIGSWLQNQKGKINSNEDDLYKKLAVNEYIKQSLDTYLQRKYK